MSQEYNCKTEDFTSVKVSATKSIACQVSAVENIACKRVVQGSAVQGSAGQGSALGSSIM